MVYVDEPVLPFRGKLYCHMFTDGPMAELHAMADRIGLKRAWFQNPKPGDHPHYDLSPSMRALALTNGAQFMPGREWARRTLLAKGIDVSARRQDVSAKREDEMSNPVYSDDGHITGHIKGEDYVTNRKASLHMLRKPPGWAVDKSIVDMLYLKGIKRVIVQESEEGKTYSAPVQSFYRRGVLIERGHGTQICLPLPFWHEDGGQAEAKQLSLFG